MKTLLALILLATLAHADRSLTLAWDANDPLEQVVEYIIYQDGIPFNSVRTTEATVTIPDGKVAITVVAVNAIGVMSAPSDPLVIMPNPTKPKGVRVKSLTKIP